jgi:hypothetical protein
LSLERGLVIEPVQGSHCARCRLDEELALIAEKLGKAKGTRGQLKSAGPGRGKKGKTGSAVLTPPVSVAPTLAELGVDRKEAAAAARYPSLVAPIY